MKKSRNTRQRTVIMELLRQTREHPPAEVIYREARKILPNISLGTVYRNLNFLREQGQVNEIRANGGASSRFEAVLPPHAHFHCRHCHSVQDIRLPDCLTNLEWARQESCISSIDGVELHVTGACSVCAPLPLPTGV